MECQKEFYSGNTLIKINITVPDIDNNKKYPTIILCHGHSRHKNDGLDRLSEVLVSAGYVTARFDFRGCSGNSARRYILNCASEWPEDLMNAISYLTLFPFVDKERIGVAGISMGAATAVEVTGKDARIRSTVSMGGIGDCYEWLKEVWEADGYDFGEFLDRLDRDRALTAATGQTQVMNVLEMYHRNTEEQDELMRESFLDEDVNAFISLASLRNMLYYRPLDQCPKITCPIFFAYGGDDMVVQPKQSKNMYEAVSSAKKKLKEYPGIEHNMPIDPKRDLVFEDIKQWFEETL